MPFFPDFTDHGIAHVERVLATATALITEKSARLFTVADAASLVLATLFHDSAMHLSEAGFFELINGGFEKYHIPPFDLASWRSSWDRFLFSVLRWDDTKLINVVGADENGAPRASARDPFADWNNLTEGDRRIIGEFIRCNHARIAHEVAVFGVPGNKGLAIKVNEKFSAEKRDLTGLIARSHNLPVRACLDYLQTKFGNRREYQGVHAVYLMTLLRVADYLQIDADRAPEIAFRYKFIPSKISTLEHEAHHAVRDVAAIHDDPEALQVHAKPERIAVFLRVEEWIIGIQREFDSSWAILGEVYGANERLRELGLKYRRLRSNFDDLSSFAQTVDYLPSRIRFDVARPELLKLLIGPLYGDDPSYGVRELVQNAVDAVREYDNYIKRHPQIDSVKRREQPGDVIVRLHPADENGLVWMSVDDRGIGMTEEVIREYFLRAGASFRKSDEWRAEFEENGDGATAKAKSRVLRSGRFGVGALAAFLIGDEIIVETRHVTASDGFRFETTLDTDAIEVFRDRNLSIGTSIRVRVNPQKIADLIGPRFNTIRPRFWDWYCMTYPSVVRIFPNKPEPKQNRFQFPAEFNTASWRKLPTTGLYDVFWTIDQAPSLTCNGLFICDATAIRNVPAKHLGRDVDFLRYPNVAVLDPDGEFPLRLKRDGLQTRDYPFGKDLIQDYLYDMIAWLFFHGPTARVHFDAKTVELKKWLSYGAYDRACVAGPQGFGLRLATLLHNLSIRHAIFARSPLVVTKIKSQDSFIFAGDFERLSYHRSFGSFEFQLNGKVIGPAGERRVEYFEPGPGSKKPRPPKALPAGFAVERRDDQWRIVASSKCPSPEFQVQEWPVTGTSSYWGGWRTSLTEVFLQPGVKISLERWILDDIWEDLFASEWLPYRFEDRLAKFPSAVKKLKRYVQSSSVGA